MTGVLSFYTLFFVYVSPVILKACNGCMVLMKASLAVLLMERGTPMGYTTPSKAPGKESPPPSTYVIAFGVPGSFVLVNSPVSLEISAISMQTLIACKPMKSCLPVLSKGKSSILFIEDYSPKFSTISKYPP